MQTKFWIVWQGLPNPMRPNEEMGWRYWNCYDNLKDAKREAKQLSYWRIDECRTVYSETTRTIEEMRE